MAEISRCLAMVCPTGYTSADREEWILSVASTLQEMAVSEVTLVATCKQVRQAKDFDHPSKFMACFRTALGDWANPILEKPSPALAISDQRNQPESPPITDDEIRAMAPSMIRMGLAMGEFTQDRVDRVRGES